LHRNSLRGFRLASIGAFFYDFAGLASTRSD
jgi:hypothetical protein